MHNRPFSEQASGVRRGRLPFPVAVLFLLACSDAARNAANGDGADGLTTVPVTPGEAIASFAHAFGPVYLDDVRGIALAKDGRSVHVLDTHHVHHLDLNGRRLADRDYGWDEPLAFSIPLDGDTISHRLARRGLGSDLVDVIVLPDRLVVASSTSVSFLRVEREQR